MNFIFNLFNHHEMGRRSLEDVIGIFGHQLRALGHTAAWDETRPSEFLTRESGINVIVEGFTDWSTYCVSQAAQQGARFLILATEEPTEKGFNHGTQKEMVLRQQTFGEAAKFCEGILHLVPGDAVTRWYSQHAPAAYVELGYAPSLVRPPLPRAEPEFEFGFYGSLSERRLKILKKLAKMTRKDKAVKIVADFKTQTDRDREMQRAKVIVQIRKFDAMGLVSSSRCNTALCIGRPVVGEPHDLALSKPWDEIVTFSDTLDGFYSVAMMASAAWRGVHAKQFEAFRTRLTPEVCVGAPLRKIGLCDNRRAA